MPGVMFTPIANLGTQKFTRSPYIPTYDSIYVASSTTYKVSGSQMGSVTEGGIAKMDFSGSLDATWNNAVNVSNGPVALSLKQVRFAGGARDSVLMDLRLVSGGIDYRDIRLVDKTTGGIVSSSGLFSDVSSSISGMDTDEEEEYIYVLGNNKLISGNVYGFNIGDATVFPKGLGRYKNGTLDIDTTFNTNIGDGPTNLFSTSDGQVKDIYVNPNGKIGVVHNGQDWNGVANKHSNMVILNNDGTVDTSFTLGAQDFKIGNNLQANGALNTINWFESGSSGVWVVGGDFDNFGTGSSSGSYEYIMAFKEDGTIDATWTSQFQEFNPSSNLNNAVNKIVDNPNNTNNPIVIGKFTAKGGSSVSGKALMIDGANGFPQLLSNGTKFDLEDGTIHLNGQFYYTYDGTSSMDQNFTNTIVDGMYACQATNNIFVDTPNFDIGAGLQTSGNASATPGSIFKG